MTLHQPWASLVAMGVKRYETRSRPPTMRLLGQRIAIHAGTRFTPVKLTQDALADITQAFGKPNWKRSLPRGVMVCTAIIAEALPADTVPADSFGDYSPERWAWRLDDVRVIEPHVPARGMQCWGWPWSVPEGVTI